MTADISTKSLSVNGTAVTVDAPSDTSLLAALRHDLGLKGTRTGCLEGHCGACTVLLDGRPVQACTTPLWSVGTARVETIESPSPHLRAVAAAFVSEQAAQCGYCINGIVMTVTGLLATRPPPDRSAIIAALDERHLCRCGTHARILRAIDRLLVEAVQP